MSSIFNIAVSQCGANFFYLYFKFRCLDNTTLPPFFDGHVFSSTAVHYLLPTSNIVQSNSKGRLVLLSFLINQTYTTTAAARKHFHRQVESTLFILNMLSLVQPAYSNVSAHKYTVQRWTAATSVAASLICKIDRHGQYLTARPEFSFI